MFIIFITATKSCTLTSGRILGVQAPLAHCQIPIITNANLSVASLYNNENTVNAK